MHFSIAQNGFFPSFKRADYEREGGWPADAKPVTPEQVATLRAAIMAGDTISYVEPTGFVITPKQPEALVDVKLRLANAVDDSIARIYSRFTRFSDEYRMREEEAKAFVAAGYTGQVGALVTGYASTQSEMTDQQAADIIIAQANAFRAALVTLGNLRMRKNEIKAASVANATAAQAIHDEIVALAGAAVVSL